MKLAIIGSRTFDSYTTLEQVLREHWRGAGYPITEIISGGARGADSLGARYAKEHGIKLTEFIPDWNKHGKKAGFLRNEDIICASDCVLCFWDGVSKGSANSLAIAKRFKKPTVIIYF